jgi:transcriptional regulator with XRE-family HTH domain
MAHIRYANGFSQKMLADSLGVDPNTVARKERGELAIADAEAALISRILDLGKVDTKRLDTWARRTRNGLTRKRRAKRLAEIEEERRIA